MIFKDRKEAGEKLLEMLIKDSEILKINKKEFVVVSLLRGGIVVADIIAKGLKIFHLPLVVTKIPVPYNPELALGALSFDVVYLEKKVINPLSLDKSTINSQIKIAREKFQSYMKQFNLKKSLYIKIKNKAIILVDDGIATGATVKTAVLFLKTKKAKKIYLAIPVGPVDFKIEGVDKQFILHRDSSFSAVSQFYSSFPQIEDKEVKRILKT